MGKGRRSYLRTLFRWILGTGSFLVFGAIGGLAFLVASTPSVSHLVEDFPDSTSFMDRERDAGQRVLWEPVPYSEISPHLKTAVLVAEDITFFEHKGFEIHEIREALRIALHGKKLRGASTLSQQLAKNLWLSPRRSFLRKLQEAVLTWKLERNMTKKRILELYLNCVEFGPGIFGAEAASEFYFEKAAGALNAREAAQLAAALPSPSHRHPGKHNARTEESVQRILYRMNRAQWLRKLL